MPCRLPVPVLWIAVLGAACAPAGGPSSDAERPYGFTDETGFDFPAAAVWLGWDTAMSFLGDQGEVLTVEVRSEGRDVTWEASVDGQPRWTLWWDDGSDLSVYVSTVHGADGRHQPLLVSDLIAYEGRVSETVVGAQVFQSELVGAEGGQVFWRFDGLGAFPLRDVTLDGGLHSFRYGSQRWVREDP